MHFVNAFLNHSVNKLRWNQVSKQREKKLTNSEKKKGKRKKRDTEKNKDTHPANKGTLIQVFRHTIL